MILKLASMSWALMVQAVDLLVDFLAEHCDSFE